MTSSCNSFRLLLLAITATLAVGTPALPASAPRVCSVFAQGPEIFPDILANEEAPSSMVLRIYNLSNLIQRRVQQAVTTEAENILSDSAPEARRQTLVGILIEEKMKPEAEALGAIIKKHMDPAWDRKKQHVVADEMGNLAILGSMKQHQWISGFLELQNRQDLSVEVHVEVFDLNANDPKTAAFLGDKPRLRSPDAESFSIRALALPGAELVSSPKLLLYPSTEANLTIGNQVAYISDWKLETVLPGPVQIADPIVDTLQTGLYLDVSAYIFSQDKIDLKLGYSQSELLRMETVEMVLAPNRKVVHLNRPVTKNRSIQTKLVIPDGGQVLLPVATEEDGQTTVLVVTARVIHMKKDILAGDQEEGK